ncbi:MAG: DUF4421 domain-containing protein [Bacteroidota bacterium]
MNRKTIILFLLFIPVICFSQKKPADSLREKEPEYDTSYITTYPDDLMFGLFGSNYYSNFSLHDNVKNQTVTYAPNSNFNLGFNTSWRWLGLSMAFDFRFMNHDEDVYGESYKFDLSSTWFFRKYMLDAGIQYNRGFYMKNAPTLFAPWTAGTSYPQYDDMHTFNMGISACYVVNYPKYSLRASFSQSEIMKKSSGSWLANIYYNLFATAAYQGIVPDTIKPLFDKNSYIYTAWVSNLGAGIGYAHTFVKDKWYFTFALVPGLSVQKYQAQGDSIFFLKSNLSLRMQSRFSFGYNADRWYYGISTFKESYAFQSTASSSLAYKNGYVRLFVGRRFKVKGKKIL